ncbi:MAG: translation initiation factor IF-2, partial [Lachnospiraceae bacterium]|nr:translation initiation factor IF-2 [Lachnospiraceae bacterium]
RQRQMFIRDRRNFDNHRGDGPRRDNNRNDGPRRDNNRSDGPRRDGQRGYDNNRNDGSRRDGQRSFDNNRGDGQRQGGRPGQGFGGNRDNRGGFGGKNAGKSGGFVPESPIKDAEKHRDEEKRRISQEKDKRNRKDLIYEEDSKNIKNVKGKNKPGKFIKPEKKASEAVEEQIKVITLPETLTIKELADKMKIQPSVIVKKLFLQGQIVTVNQEIPYETAENIAIEYDIICEQEVKVDVIEELLKEEDERQEDMVPRSPVICVMGHVDHGKTSLLDAIRKTNVTDKEAGGITQHIGAYTVTVNGQKITFLDTPGHEAFTAMRMRGANSTDIAILVVAADDGVMPQTVEAISHAKAAGIEIIVAVNKIDKPGANIERVKQELTEYGLIAEDWGGSTVFVPVSAKSGEGIEQLLEMILLTAEVLELKANPNRRARGLVIEAELDKGRGPVATILVQKGTLYVGDFVSAGAASGKVRAMVDDKGRRVKEAGPSMPVEILGLGDVPNAGEIFIAHENDKEAKYYAETFVAQNKEKLLEDTKAKMSLDDLFSQIQAGNLKELNLIIKADVQGSVEAVKQSLMKLSNEEVVVKCIHGGVGAINESDVSLASASKAIIIGFNVRPDTQAKATAEREGVDVRLYKVIYQAIEDIEAAMKGMLEPVFEEKVIGHAEVRQIFKASAVGNIAGSYVLDGVFQRGCKIRITREGEQIYEGELASLKRFKDDVKEVRAGFECGLVFEGFDSMQELDIAEAYIMVEVPR